MHVGTIMEVNDFPEARKPAYQLTIDFGETIGIRKLRHKLPNAIPIPILLRQIVA
jgi:tRNA-binding protein